MRCLSDSKLLREMIQINNGNPIDMWVCDYELKQSGNQKLRDIRPTKVQVVLDHSTLEFYPYTKSGKISKNPISVYSYNSYDYYGAHIFHTEEEAIEQYNNCIWEQIKTYESEISELQERKLKLEDRFINTDIVMETLVRN